jgi:class 3 adenylate cyclase
VLFVDMVGFTGVASALDPEDVRALQTEYFAAVAEVVHRWGGVVEKYVGDAVMALFGAPRSDGYDAYRAVRAGMRLPEAVGRLRLPGGQPVRVRVGIATGEALVASAAATGGQCLVSGDVVNMAARLQAVARPGTVAVTAGTERATGALIRYERLAPAAVAGRAEPLEIWRPLDGPADSEPAGDTPLIGRDAELTAAADRIGYAISHGVPQLISISSAAGAGKSRLVAELRRYPGIGAHDGVCWLVGRCLPGGELDRPLTELVERGAECAETRRPTVLVVEDRHWAGVPVARFLRGVLATATAAGSPMAVLVTSRSDEGGPALAGTDCGLAPDCRIALAPLTGADTGRLLRHLLRRAGQPVGFARALLPLVRGNPAYAEAYVRLVAARGTPVRGTPATGMSACGMSAPGTSARGMSATGAPARGTSVPGLSASGTPAPGAVVPVPEPVRAGVAARLDRLGTGERRAVLAAAVLGPGAPTEALAYLLGCGAGEVRALLRRAVRSGLLVPSAVPGGGAGYAFVDPAVRAVAYARLPRRERIELHRAAAQWWDGRPRAGRDSASARVRHWLAVLRLSRLLRRDATPYRRPVLRAIADATACHAQPRAATGRGGRSAARPGAHCRHRQHCRQRRPARADRLTQAARPPPAARSTACRYGPAGRPVREKEGDDVWPG